MKETPSVRNKGLPMLLAADEAASVDMNGLSCDVAGSSFPSEEDIRFSEVEWLTGTPQRRVATKAFYIFARTAKVLYQIGAALELRRLGYRFEKVNMGDQPLYS